MPLVLAMAAPSPRMPDTPLWDVPEEGRTLAIGHVADGPSPNMAVSGDVAQLEEHLLCKQGVAGSSPVVSTTHHRHCALFRSYTSAAGFSSTRCRPSVLP